MCPSVVAFILAVIPLISKGQNANTCDVTPKDLYIEVGSDIEIVCQSSCAPGKIFWTLNSNRIDESLSNTISDSYTELSLTNFTHHRAILQCHSADTRLVLGGTTIETYSKPSNISCLLYYKYQRQQGVPELLTCKWDHQMKPPPEINYTVLVSLSDGQNEICTSKVTNCTAKYRDLSKIMYLLENYTVTVRAKSAYWEAYSEPYAFELFDILKIIPPKLDITVSSDYLWVEWKPTVVKRKCHCEVSYSKAVGDGPPKGFIVTVEPEKKKTVNLTVESCIDYNVSVRCALEKAPWSDWSNKTVLTKLNKKDVKLRLWRNVAEVQENGVRRVHAMWTEIPSTCQGTFTYTIKQAPYMENMTEVSYTDPLCSSSTCDVDVNPDAERIKLTVFHNKALLAEESVYVPAAGECLPRVTEIHTTTAEGVILVSWKAPVQPVRGYMIDWTHDGNRYYWKESEHTNTKLFDLLDKKPYNITVTPLFDDKTGHGTQALHVCSRVGDPDNFTVVVQPNDRSAHVSWSVKSVEECSGAVVNYTVFYSNLTGPVLSVTVDNTQKEIVLKGLNPDTQYSLYVEATALTGTTKSNETHFETKRFDLRLITALFVSGSIVIILGLTLGLCCAVQWKKLGEKALPNPGLSSLALWPSPGHQKGMCPFQAFNNPSESICDRVYTEEPWRASTPPPTTSCNGNPASDQTEEYTDPAIALAPEVQNEKPDELLETQHQGSAGESTVLLPSENCPISPYRSQSSVETPALWPDRKSKCVPEKQPEKTAPVTVYVTLNMFEQDQGR